MSITKLHIFHKNTDAVASIRGYEFQKLKTLEAWLENGIAQNDELIYCEYEEDIFQRNATTQVSKFRQIKLYSSNFSFSTEEIQKALVHFFSLFTKGDYLFDNVKFVFEANSTIAREQANNSGQLLKDWDANQKALPNDLLTKCISICKEIISEHYTSEYKVKESAGALTKEIEEGFYSFKKLDDKVWEEFVKAIEWKFDGITPEQAVDKLVVNIGELILEQPRHNVKKEELNTVLAYLLYEVTKKSIQKDPNDRVLALTLLETRLLEQGSEMDKWYSKVFNDWKDVKEVKYFIIGDFYEVLSAAQYCRNNSKLFDHAEIWKNILNLYYSLEGVPEYHRKKAVYERVWLTIKPDYDNFKLEEGLKTLDAELKFYLASINGLSSKEEFEDALNILNIVFGLTAQKQTSFTLPEIMKAEQEYSGKLEKHIENAADVNLKCYLLEYKGLHNISFFLALNKIELNDAIQPFFEIIKLLPDASLFNITQLAERLGQMNEGFIKHDYDKHEAIIKALDQVVDALQPFALKREGTYKVAKQEIKRGVAYIESNKKEGLLKALSHFHNAKDHYLTDATMEGYVLAVLNISQLYASVGLNYAAKYYALTGLWVSVNDEKAKLLGRISKSFQFVFMSDFSQGAWMSAIASFNHFLHAKLEFETEDSYDDSTDKTMIEIGLLLSVSKVIKPDLNSQFEFLKKSWGDRLTKEINELVGECDNNLPTTKKKWSLLEKRLWDRPFSDLGKIREICWETLGSKWTIIFENTSDITAIAEEFCSIIQIFIAEIALNNSDFHLLKSNINIELSLGKEYKKPEQIPDNSVLKYKIVLKKLESTDKKEILHHNAMIGSFLLLLFGEISLLKMEEIIELYKKLFSEQSLSHKTFTLNSYQRMYSAFFESKQFEMDQRANYEIPASEGKFPKSNDLLEWPSFFSEKYSKKESIELITNRYNNSEKVTALTISKLINEPTFIAIIKHWRKEGWLDWQILLAILNFILDYKTKLKLKNKTFSSDEELYEETHKVMMELKKIEEKDFYVKFPPEAFETELIEMQFQQMPSIVLKTWGLECRSKTPNFEALREFLNHRFNFNVDEVIERSPFSKIV